jgi:transposase
MLFGETSLLPIFFSIHQGSIRDMKTLKNMIAIAEHLKKNSVYLDLSKKKRLPSNFTHLCQKYLIIRNSNERIIIHLNESAVAEHSRYSGYLVIINNDLTDAFETLHKYRSKNVIERAFDYLKNELDLKRLRVHSESDMTGRVFLRFFSLILRSRINKRMKETSLYKKFTQEEVMGELKRLKIIELSDNKIILKEISNNQSGLFKLFQIPPQAVTKLYQPEILGCHMLKKVSLE